MPTDNDTSTIYRGSWVFMDEERPKPINRRERRAAAAAARYRQSRERAYRRRQAARFGWNAAAGEYSSFLGISPTARIAPQEPAVQTLPTPTLAEIRGYI